MKGGTEFRFVTDGIHAALEQAREAAGGHDVRLGGGVATIRQYLHAGLVDELHLAVSPVLLGTGEHLLHGIDLRALGYECTSHRAAAAPPRTFFSARRRSARCARGRDARFARRFLGRLGWGHEPPQKRDRGPWRRRLPLPIRRRIFSLRLRSLPPPPSTPRSRGGRCGLDLFHTGGPKGEVVAVAGAGAVDDGPWAGQPDAPRRRHEPRDVLLRGPRPGDEPRPLLARLFVDLRRVGDDGRAEEDRAHLPRVAALPVAEGARAGRPVAARRREPLPASLRRRSSTRPPANPAPRAPRGKVWTVFENGPATEKVDLLVLGEGYAEKDLPKFHADVKRLVDLLFTYEPFKSRREDFNVRALDLPSAESGVTRPHSKIFRRTPLSAQYGIFGSERYVLTYDDRALRDAASAAPYDFLEILVNDARYGGGGIFNAPGDGGRRHRRRPSTSSSTSSATTSPALADEYYTSDVAYETGAAEKPEPWEPNVTALKAREEAEVGGPRRRRDAAPDAVGEGDVREAAAARSRDAPRDRRRRHPAVGARRPLPRGGEGGDGAPRLG